MSQVQEEKVLDVHHWSPTLFSFRTTRRPSFRFRNGHFVMVGLPGLPAGDRPPRPVLRAYSMVSPNYEEHLEFYSIKIPDGELTSRLQHIQPGDSVLIGNKPTGTLVIDYLTPGKRLYLLATGTGLAPFLSIIRDPETYARFERVILVHGVRHVVDLGYREYIEEELPRHELVGDEVRGQLLYYPTVTREPFRNTGRITALLDGGKLPADLGLPALDPAHDRVMICGSPAMLKETVALLQARAFPEGTSDHPGAFLIERAFAER